MAIHVFIHSVCTIQNGQTLCVFVSVCSCSGQPGQVTQRSHSVLQQCDMEVVVVAVVASYFLNENIIINRRPIGLDRLIVRPTLRLDIGLSNLYQYLLVLPYMNKLILQNKIQDKMHG